MSGTTDISVSSTEEESSKSDEFRSNNSLGEENISHKPNGSEKSKWKNRRRKICGKFLIFSLSIISILLLVYSIIITTFLILALSKRNENEVGDEDNLFFLNGMKAISLTAEDKENREVKNYGLLFLPETSESISSTFSDDVTLTFHEDYQLDYMSDYEWVCQGTCSSSSSTNNNERKSTLLTPTSRTLPILTFTLFTFLVTQAKQYYSSHMKSTGECDDGEEEQVFDIGCDIRMARKYRGRFQNERFSPNEDDPGDPESWHCTVKVVKTSPPPHPYDDDNPRFWVSCYEYPEFAATLEEVTACAVEYFEDHFEFSDHLLDNVEYSEPKCKKIVLDNKWVSGAMHCC